MSKRPIRRPVGQSINKYWKLRAFKRLGGMLCQCCEEWRKPFLTIDHIEGKGIAHRKQFKGGQATFYKWIATTTEDPTKILQILCMNCNWAKRYGECPHQRATKKEIAREETELLRNEIEELTKERTYLQGQISRFRLAIESPVIFPSQPIPPGYTLARQIGRLDWNEFVKEPPANPLAAINS